MGSPVRKFRPYVDRGQSGALRYDRESGELLRTKEPPPAEYRILTLQAMRRHNSLNPALQPTFRMMLRWTEGGGNGESNPEADKRETHYDPLPPDLQKKVDSVVYGSPWEYFATKFFRTNSTCVTLADTLGISRTQLYKDLDNMLWYFCGQFRARGIHE